MFSWKVPNILNYKNVFFEMEKLRNAVFKIYVEMKIN